MVASIRLRGKEKTTTADACHVQDVHLDVSCNRYRNTVFRRTCIAPSL
ncbi:MAG: hypothetical protein JXQ73_28610 [Phycisphaerae bacterium]|nr:hypothetical protein [Phycisphaerae bacterium]